MHQEEINNLGLLIESNPIISERNARIADLQARLKLVDVANTYDNLQVMLS